MEEWASGGVEQLLPSRSVLLSPDEPSTSRVSSSTPKSFSSLLFPSLRGAGGAEVPQPLLSTLSSPDDSVASRAFLPPLGPTPSFAPPPLLSVRRKSPRNAGGGGAPASDQAFFSSSSSTGKQGPAPQLPSGKQAMAQSAPSQARPLEPLALPPLVAAAGAGLSNLLDSRTPIVTTRVAGGELLHEQAATKMVAGKLVYIVDEKYKT